MIDSSFIKLVAASAFQNVEIEVFDSDPTSLIVGVSKNGVKGTIENRYSGDPLPHFHVELHEANPRSYSTPSVSDAVMWFSTVSTI